MPQLWFSNWMRRGLSLLLALGFFARSSAVLACIEVPSWAPVPANKPTNYPSWWFGREVIPRTDPSEMSPEWPQDYPASDEYAILTSGQLKQLTTQAYAELFEKFPNQPWGIPGTPAGALQSLIYSWHEVPPSAPLPTGTAHHAVNQGQLKTCAKAVYDVLAEGGYHAGQGLPPDEWTSGIYPWTETTADDSSFNAANLGMAKYLFSFDFDPDRDRDGMTDTWERAYFGDLDETGSDDWDGDGETNAEEFGNASDPTDYYSREGGMIAATLTVISGNRQVGPAGTLLGQRIVVEVSGSGGLLYGAPVRISADGNLLRLAGHSGSPVTELQLVANGQGRVEFEVFAPDQAGSSARMELMAGGADAEAEVFSRPDDFSGLQGAMKLWFRADVGVNTGSDGKVNEWVDLSGRGTNLSQTEEVRRPEWRSSRINGRPAVYFDGNNDYLAGANQADMTGSPGVTFLAVMKSEGTATTNPFENRQIYMQQKPNGSYGLDVYRGSSWIHGASGPFTPATYPVGTYRLVLCRYDGDTGQHEIFVNADCVAMTATHPGSLGKAAVTTFKMGAYYSESQGFWKGEMAEFVAFDRALNDRELDDVLKRVGERYALFGATDADADGLPDWWENKHLGSISHDAEQDPDGDGLNNRLEYEYRIHPAKADTDGDGASDGAEVALGLNPLNVDTDWDGVRDGAEVDEGMDAANFDDYISKRLSLFSFSGTDLASNEGQLPWVAAGIEHVPGWRGKGMRINEVGDLLAYRRVRTDGSPNICLKRGTVRFWLKPEWNTSQMTGYWSRWVQLGRYMADNSKALWYFQQNSTLNTVFFGAKDGSGHPGATMTSPLNWNANEWVQIALTYTPTSKKLYVNGLLVNSITHSWIFEPRLRDLDETGLMFGSDGHQPIKGVMDEAEFFNYPLSASEIAANYDSEIALGPDSDVDNLPDQWELAHWGNLSQGEDGDPDGDGLTNQQEYRAGTNPTHADTDGDGLPDGYEANNKLDPMNAGDALEDADGDRVPNIFEYVHGTSASDPQSRPAPHVVIDITGNTSGSFSSIQDGLNTVTQDNQIVEVGPGLYGETYVTLPPYRVLIYSRDGAAATVIDAMNDSSSGLAMTTDAVVDGVTICNGNAGWYGGGVMIWGGTVRLVNCVIRGNQSPGPGSAVFAYNAGVSLINCTLFENVSSWGYAALATAQGTLTLTNTISWNAGTEIGPDEFTGQFVVTAVSSNIEGGFAGPGNLNTDPQLLASGHLSSESPCIDAGTLAGAPRGDMDKEARPFGPKIDMGADEFVDADMDGNGLPDGWENRHFGETGVDPQGDPDHDGLSTLLEYQNGTSPTVAETTGALNALGQSVLIGEDHQLVVALRSRGGGAEPAVYTIIGEPNHGTLEIEDGVVTYFPHAHFHGRDQFRFRVSKGEAWSEAVVDIVVTPENDAPLVSVSGPITAVVSGTVSLSASVVDIDNAPGEITANWLKVSGPGGVTFASPDELTTTAFFSGVGEYVIRLVASDGQHTRSDSLVVLVNAGDAVLPFVTLQSPSENAAYTYGQPVAIVAAASPGAGAAVAVVEFYEGSRKIGQDAASVGGNYVTSWIPPRLGIYLLSAAVSDSNGTRNVSEPVWVRVTERGWFAGGETGVGLSPSINTWGNEGYSGSGGDGGAGAGSKTGSGGEFSGDNGGQGGGTVAGGGGDGFGNPSGTDPSAVDMDHDGLTAAQEARLGTNPLSADTDGDGIPDNQDPHPLVPEPQKPYGLSVVASDWDRWLAGEIEEEDIDYTKVELKWAHQGGNVTQFLIEKQISIGNWIEIGRVSAGTLKFEDDQLLANQNYYYRVSAINTRAGKQAISGPSATVRYQVPLLTAFSAQTAALSRSKSEWSFREFPTDDPPPSVPKYYLVRTRTSSIHGSQNGDDSSWTYDGEYHGMETMVPSEHIRLFVGICWDDYNISYSDGGYFRDGVSTHYNWFDQSRRKSDLVGRAVGDMRADRTTSWDGGSSSWDSTGTYVRRDTYQPNSGSPKWMGNDFDLANGTLVVEEGVSTWERNDHWDNGWSKQMSSATASPSGVWSGTVTYTNSSSSNGSSSTITSPPWSGSWTYYGWWYTLVGKTPTERTYNGDIPAGSTEASEVLSEEYLTEDFMEDVYNDLPDWPDGWVFNYYGWGAYIWGYWGGSSNWYYGAPWYGWWLAYRDLGLGEENFSISRMRYKIRSSPTLPFAMEWFEIFVPEDDPQTEESESINQKVVKTRLWNLPPGGGESPVYEIDPFQEDNGDGNYYLAFPARLGGYGDSNYGYWLDAKEKEIVGVTFTQTPISSPEPDDIYQSEFWFALTGVARSQYTFTWEGEGIKLFLSSYYNGTEWMEREILKGETLTQEELETSSLNFLMRVNPQEMTAAFAEIKVATTDYTGVSMGEDSIRAKFVPQLLVDGNRDGQVAFDDENARAADQTTEWRPFRFWCNDDCDGSGDGAEGANAAADSADGEIKSKRDLEDFSRLHLYFGGLQAGIANGTFRIGLKWKNTGALRPTIKVYEAVEAGGGTAYLSSETTAAAQISGSYRTVKATVSAENTTATILPASVFANFAAENPVAHLLFEGVSDGKGQLVVTLHKADGTEIGEGLGVWLEITNIHQMYERGLSNPINMSAPFNRESNFDINNGSVTKTGTFFQKPSDETQQCIIYVHGWNTDMGDYSRNCATMYKRLFHRGFKGRFAGFRWDTLKGGAAESFHVSEWRGYKSGKALHDYVVNLKGRLPNYSINVIAHSLGSAPLTVALERGAAIDNCIYTQGALTAHVFDPNAPMRINPLNPIPIGNFNTPDLAIDGGYRGWMTSGAVTIVNFYNEGDHVLNVLWKAVQNGKPHNASGPAQYKYTASTGRRWIEYSSGPLANRDVFDNHESMAFVAIGRAAAVGAEGATAGAVDSSFNLGSGGLAYGAEHSPQFAFHIQKNLIPYYNELMDRFSIPFNP